jgi:predicted double-glycine peptidase
MQTGTGCPADFRCHCWLAQQRFRRIAALVTCLLVLVLTNQVRAQNDSNQANRPAPPPARPQNKPISLYDRAPIRDPERIMREYVWSYKELRERNIVMQRLDYSCGAAALATVFRYYWGANVNETTFLLLMHKLKLTPEQIRDRIENGLTLTDLRDIANLAGYQSSMGKVSFEELAKAKVPVIVGITVRKHDHFAVFRGTDGYYAYLADPIRGNIRVTVTEFERQWQKNAILVVAKPGAKVKDPNPLGVTFPEVFRGVLNDQTVHRNQTMIPVPNPVRTGP